jgi:hypothetical protein
LAAQFEILGVPKEAQMKFPRNDEERVAMIQVADWIEKGLALPNLKEDCTCYLSKGGEDGQYDSDVLGLALAGKEGSAKQALAVLEEAGGSALPADETSIMAELLGVSYGLAFALDYFHSEEEVSAQSLANWLRAGEFEFGDDELEDGGLFGL